MSDEDDYDPDAEVPLWVNIVVPIITGLLFLTTLVILFHTKKEVPVEKLHEWAEKIPFLNKWTDDESTATAKTSTVSKAKFNEKSKIHKSENIRRYDSIASMKTHNTTISDTVSQSTAQNSYFYASQGTLMSFESSV